MQRKFLNIAMYDAMDCLYGEHPSEELLQFVSAANPYLYKDRKAVDPAIQSDFERSMDKQGIEVNVDEETAYYAVKNFLTEQNSQFAELFADISLSEWKKLCAIIAEEETAR